MEAVKLPTKPVQGVDLLSDNLQLHPLRRRVVLALPWHAQAHRLRAVHCWLVVRSGRPCSSLLLLLLLRSCLLSLLLLLLGTSSRRLLTPCCCL